MREHVPLVPDRQAIYRRLVAFGPVILLHAGLLIALLHVNWSALNVFAPGHEIILLLKPVPVKPAFQGDLLPPLESAESGMPRLAVPDIQGPPPAAAASNLADLYAGDIASAVQSTGGDLFRCWPKSAKAPAKIGDAQCLMLTRDHAFDFLVAPERAQNADIWQRDRDRRNAPLLMPCWSGMSLATVTCVANGLVNGFDLENRPGYADADKDWHMTGADAERREMQTVDPCGVQKTIGPAFLCLNRIVNGSGPP
jgi:hypothetical protein